MTKSVAAANTRPYRVSPGKAFVMPSLTEFGISQTEARVGISAIRALLNSVPPPQVIVNRNADDALRVLTKNQFSTLHSLANDRPDLARESIAIAAATRKEVEQRRGTYGTGKDAGRTVYGSVHLGLDVGAERSIEDVLKKGASRPTRQAVGYYLGQGAVSFVLKPEVLRKSTFLGCDSFADNAWTPGSFENLPEVMFSALARIAHSNEETKQLEKVLKLPPAKRQVALQRIFSSDMFQVAYIEAQMRNPTRQDIDYIVIKKDVRNYPDGYLADTKAGTHAKVVKDVVKMAKQLGIQVVEV